MEPPAEPLEKELKEAVPPVVPAPAPASPAGEIRTILLVDDEDDVREVLAEQLHHGGLPGRRGRGSRLGGQAGRPALQGGHAFPAGHRPGHADLGGRLVPGRLRGRQAALEDEPRAAGADDDREPQRRAPGAGQADGNLAASSSSPGCRSWTASSSRRTCELSRQARGRRAALARQAEAQRPAAAKAPRTARARSRPSEPPPTVEELSRQFDAPSAAPGASCAGPQDATQISALVMRWPGSSSSAPSCSW